jgi:hypothetical protein
MDRSRTILSFRRAILGGTAAAVFLAAGVAYGAPAASANTRSASLIPRVCIYNVFTGQVITCVEVAQTKQICVYNPLTGKLIRCVPSGAVRANAGRRSSAGSAAAAICVYNPLTGKLIRCLPAISVDPDFNDCIHGSVAACRRVVACIVDPTLCPSLSTTRRTHAARVPGSAASDQSSPLARGRPH